MTREEPSLETLWLQNIETMDKVQSTDRSNTAPSSKHLEMNYGMNSLSRFRYHESYVPGESKFLDWSLDLKIFAQSFGRPRSLRSLCVKSRGSLDVVGWKSTSSQTLTSYLESRGLEWSCSLLHQNSRKTNTNWSQHLTYNAIVLNFVSCKSRSWK
jgi:hypothetical protein